jgi:hypothetical protein
MMIRCVRDCGALWSEEILVVNSVAWFSHSELAAVANSCKTLARDIDDSVFFHTMGDGLRSLPRGLVVTSCVK